MGNGLFVFLMLVAAVVAVLALLWVARGVDDATRPLCRDALRRLGPGYSLVPGSGFTPNRIVAREPGYELVAALHPGRRTGFRLYLDLKARGDEYRDLAVWERRGRIAPRPGGLGRLEERRTGDAKCDAAFAVRGSAAAAARLGEEARAILERGRTALPGDLAIDRGVIRYEFHQGALLDADAVAEIVTTVVALHAALSGSPAGAGPRG